MTKSVKESPAKGIRGWPAGERPRERLLTRGPGVLTDAQLLAALFGVGRSDGSAVDVARELLERLGGLRGVAAGGLSEFYAVRGIGPAKVAQIKAAIELGRRFVSAPLAAGTCVHSSEEIFEHYGPYLRDLRREVFKAVLLDAKHAVIQDVTVSEGSLTQSIVHPREVFNLAVRESAAAVIFLHNHPSGRPQPSSEDHALTKRLVAAGLLLGIPVLDHIIVGDGAYVSFADEGWLCT